MRLRRFSADDTFPEPLRQRLVVHIPGGDRNDCIGDGHVVLDQTITAPTQQQFDKIERRTFVSVDKTVAGNNPVNEGGSLFVNESVIAVVRPRER